MVWISWFFHQIRYTCWSLLVEVHFHFESDTVSNILCRENYYGILLYKRQTKQVGTAIIADIMVPEVAAALQQLNPDKEASLDWINFEHHKEAVGSAPCRLAPYSTQLHNRRISMLCVRQRRDNILILTRRSKNYLKDYPACRFDSARTSSQYKIAQRNRTPSNKWQEQLKSNNLSFLLSSDLLNYFLSSIL